VTQISILLERAGWAASCMLAALAVHAWRTEDPGYAPQSSREQGALAMTKGATSRELSEAANEVIVNNPFRISRRPSGVPFGSETRQPEQQQPASTPRPNLVLVGIVGGPPWIALVQGVPGREGLVVFRQGDTVAGLSISEVTRQGAVVIGADTLWRLALKRFVP